MPSTTTAVRTVDDTPPSDDASEAAHAQAQSTMEEGGGEMNKAKTQKEKEEAEVEAAGQAASPWVTHANIVILLRSVRQDKVRPPPTQLAAA